ncbi:MAG: hypothetical protein H6978_03260 [Gammaproteobacteria bacterium]|nr:hypothetical protein [Gammaproteobacteria bacterium]
MARVSAQVRIPRQPAWQALRYFSLYRIILSGLFSVLVLTGNAPPPLGSTDASLFEVTAIGYLIVAIAELIAVENKLIPYPVQVYVQVALDVVALTLILHASGGIASGLGILLVVAVAGSSLLSSGRVALLSAALAALAVLAQSLVHWSVSEMQISFTQAGMLGAALFTTAFFGYLLAERVRVSEALAARQALDLASLSQLNEHIVQRMRSGILALGPGGRIMLMNNAAVHLLGLEAFVSGMTLSEVAPTLAERHLQWMQSTENSPRTFKSARSGLELQPSFTRIGADAMQGALVYLEDAGEMRQRAQQLKLASLGRLTASIAHEIRNPLGAISHAGQLLSESGALTGADQRLTQIIAQHSRRMNAIIENVLAVGRRESVMPESFDLVAWVREFASELSERCALGSDDLIISADPEVISVRMDRSQLHQIMWNLAENALRYSRGRPLLRINCGVVAGAERPFVELVDSGPGMTSDVAEQVFEPFFTSESTGTGLGLYIARELAESNQASLSMLEHGGAGCTFRLLFAHPERRQVGE